MVVIMNYLKLNKVQKKIIVRIVLVSVLMIAVILSNRAYLSAILNDSNNSDSGIHVII